MAVKHGTGVVMKYSPECRVYSSGGREVFVQRCVITVPSLRITSTWSEPEKPGNVLENEQVHCVRRCSVIPVSQHL